MELQPFGDEQLNFLKFASLVLDEFPKALRQAFKTMWDNKYGHRPDFQVWDDSTIVRKMFYTEEENSGKKTEVPFTSLTMIVPAFSRPPYLLDALPQKDAPSKLCTQSP